MEIIEQLMASYGQEGDVKKEIDFFKKEAGKSRFEDAKNFYNNSDYIKS